MIQIPNKHRGILIGALAGALIGLTVIYLGFWKSIVLVFFVACGLFAGFLVDSNPEIKDRIKGLIDSIFRR